MEELRKRFNRLCFALKNIVGNSAEWRVWKNVVRYDSFDAEAKRKTDWQERVKLVEYAYNNSPFYKKFYDEKGFNPSLLKSEQDWNRVPILEKKMIRHNAEEIKSAAAPKGSLSASSTNGSTGMPLTFYKSNESHINVLHWRSLSWWGLSQADNEGIVHRRVPTTVWGKIKNRLMWWPTRRAYLSALKITDADIARFVGELNRKKIVWLQGYCGALESVADYILAHNLSTPTLKMIWSTSSVLTETLRSKFEKAFGCPVMDQYGSMEMGNIASQRPSENCLTVHSDFVHVDIAGNDDNIVSANGIEGDILITDFKSRYFPLIKYRLGDRGSKEKDFAESADGYPRLSFIKGRMTDNIYLPDGKGRISGNHLSAMAHSFGDAVSNFQICQHKDFSISIKIVLYPNVEPSDSRIEDCLAKINELFAPHGLLPNVEYVDEIPHAAGKRHFVVSEVALSAYNESYSK